VVCHSYSCLFSELMFFISPCNQLTEVSSSSHITDDENRAEPPAECHQPTIRAPDTGGKLSLLYKCVIMSVRTGFAVKLMPVAVFPSKLVNLTFKFEFKAQKLKHLRIKHRFHFMCSREPNHHFLGNWHKRSVIWKLLQCCCFLHLKACRLL